MINLPRNVSQRLIVSFLGILFIQVCWNSATNHLYSLPHEALAGFVSITTNTLYITGAIVIFMVTGKLVYDWKMGTNQIQEVVSRVDKIKEEITDRIIKPKHFDDGEI